MESKKTDNKRKDKKPEIIINVRKPPSEFGILSLNKAWLNILKELEKNGCLD